MQTAIEQLLAGETSIPADRARLRAELLLPTASRGVVILGRSNMRSGHGASARQIAQLLRGRRLGTLLVDLLTPEERQAEHDARHVRADIDLLGERALAAVDWVGAQPDARQLPIGLFGTGLSAPAALIAAAQRPRQVAAVVCRGGRPDLAGDWLEHVRAATLLIVPGEGGLEPSLAAYERLPGAKSLQSVAGARSFREPAARARAAALTVDWFESRLAGQWGAAASLQSSML